MINVVSKRTPSISSERKTAECPFCGEIIMFYTAPSHICLSCKSPVLNLLMLMHDYNYRIDYHFEAINLKGSRVK